MAFCRSSSAFDNENMCLLGKLWLGFAVQSQRQNHYHSLTRMENICSLKGPRSNSVEGSQPGRQNHVALHVISWCPIISDSGVLISNSEAFLLRGIIPDASCVVDAVSRLLYVSTDEFPSGSVFATHRSGIFPSGFAFLATRGYNDITRCFVMPLFLFIPTVRTGSRDGRARHQASSHCRSRRGGTNACQCALQEKHGSPGSEGV